MKAFAYIVFVVKLLWLCTKGFVVIVASFIIAPAIKLIYRAARLEVRRICRVIIRFYRSWVRRSGLRRVLLWHGASFVILMVVFGPWGDAPRKPQADINQAKEQAAPAIAPKPTNPKPNEAPAPTKAKAMTPKATLGKGAWIYALDRLEAESVKGIKDPSARRDTKVRAIVAKAKKNGLNYLIVRTSRHGVSVSTCPPDFAEALRDACHREGIKVWGYGRISANDVEAEVERAKEVLRPAASGGYGFDGYIFDAEDETYGHDGNVKAMLSTIHDWLKTTVPSKHLAYSTYGIPSFHSWFPRDLYNSYCHYAMPQLYWASWRQGKLHWSIKQSLQRSLDEWKGCPLPVVPTVQSYLSIKPEEMAKFLSGWDTQNGFNTFRWELTGAEQWQAIRDFKCGEPSYKLASPAVPKKATAAQTIMPKMPLRPTGKGDLTGMIVVIDPGHGGMDSGCWWTIPGGTTFLEASLTYMMSWELATLVRQRGATVYLTAFDPVMYRQPATAQERIPKPSGAKLCSSGTTVHPGLKTYQRRVATAKKALKAFGAGGAKIAWVSIHVDSTGGDLEGAHVLRKLSGSNPLADAIGAELVGAKIAWNHKKVPVVFTSTKNSESRPGKKESVYVLDSNPLRLVALVETGFPRGSGRDSWRLRSPEHRRKIVDAIADGLAAVNR